MGEPRRAALAISGACDFLTFHRALRLTLRHGGGCDCLTSRRYCFRSNSGSLAKLTASRHASSLVSILAAVRRPGSSSK